MRYAHVWQAGKIAGLDHTFQIAGDLHAVADPKSSAVHLYWRNADHELIHQKFYGDGFGSYAENVTAGWPHVAPALNIVDGLTAVIGPDGASQHVSGKTSTVSWSTIIGAHREAGRPRT
jgi:hypothetical protein